MQPAIIFDLQKEFLTEATSAPKLFWDFDKIDDSSFAMLQRVKI
jgi:hypothetical protein